LLSQRTDSSLAVAQGTDFGEVESEIFHVTTDLNNLMRSRNSGGEFEGATIDTGAQKSVIGLPQAEDYDSMTRTKLNLMKSYKIFKFGDITSRSLGAMLIEFPCPLGILKVYVDVVSPIYPCFWDWISWTAIDFNSSLSPTSWNTCPSTVRVGACR
jgi:hypothetical protein